MAAAAESLVVRCAWCGRVRVDAGWVIPQDPVEPERATHGICHVCVIDLETRGRSRLPLRRETRAS